MFQRVLVGVPRTSALPSLLPSDVPPTRSPVDTAQIPSSAHTGHQGVSVCVFVSGRGAGAQNCKSWHSEVGGQDMAQGGENTGRARPG
jgi:hypothetical protein